MAQTPLQILQKLDISKHRAEKALAATGNRDAQLALNWLLEHVNDPTLDFCTNREYILYACPTGAFQQQLERYWSQTRAQYGWNGAHNFVPHITLVSFFQAPDEYAPQLADALRQAVAMATASCPGEGASLLDGRRPLQLELSGNDQFIGFYVRDNETNDANMLQRLALQYVQNVKEVLGDLISEKYEQLDALVTCFPWCGGVSNPPCIPRSSRSISLEPHDNKLHLTLAYKFAAEDAAALHTAARQTLDPAAATHWELRLYSRDPQLTRYAAPVVHRVLADTVCEQLELRANDLVYLTCITSPGAADSIAVGSSARTGCEGAVQVANTERTAESLAWTLHQTVAISAPAPAPVAAETAAGLSASATPATAAECPDVAHIRELIRASALCDLAQLDNGSTAAAGDRLRQQLAEAQAGGAEPAQQLYVMRHGERVDFTFGPDWYASGCFEPAAEEEETGGGGGGGLRYRPLDMNMPRSLPQRSDAPASWVKDGPLTCIGRQQAWLTGRSMREAGVRLRHVYCSPALRSLETCAAVLKGLQQSEECAIRVEPALFEWLVWYNEPGAVAEVTRPEAPGFPQWMTVAELVAAGYNVDEGYVPVMEVAELRERRAERCEEFYARNAAVAERAARENATGNILCVGHAVTLDACTKQLTTGSGRCYAEMQARMPRVGYASFVMAERQPDGGWRLQAPPFAGLTHNRNTRFDWKLLLDDGHD